MVQRLADGPLETKYGPWHQHIFWDGYRQSIAMVYGDIAGGERIVCRIHSSCVTAHVFFSVECDCREQMAIAMERIQSEGEGVVVWLDQEGRDNGMVAHIESQKLKRSGISQSDAYEELGYPRDSRRYEVAARILQHLDVRSIVVITNNPEKIRTLAEAGVPVLLGDERAVINPDNEFLERQYEDKIEDGHKITRKRASGHQDST